MIKTMNFSLLKLILRQSIMDFRTRNLGTFLGATWAILSPLTTIGLIFFVFSFGLKAEVMGNVSFIHWFVPAMLAWTFLCESISISCTSIVANSYLVTKIVFPVWTLPIARVFSTLPVHMFLMTIFMLTLLLQGVAAIVTWIQLLYYLFCCLALCVAFAFITSSLMVFVRDVANVVGVCLQILFWATPIFWDPNKLNGTRFQWLLLSPFNYILQGYRDSLFNKIWFWERPLQTFVFWLILFFLLVAAFFLFKRTRPHFADVL